MTGFRGKGIVSHSVCTTMSAGSIGQFDFCGRGAQSRRDSGRRGTKFSKDW
jgi:hypothetical protein